MEADKKGAPKSLCCILNALEVRMSLMMREGEVGAIGTTNKAAMGYYLVKWLSKLYTLQEETEGMSDEQMIPAGNMVVDALYFNWMEHAPLWYTPSGTTTVVEVKYVLQTGMGLQPVIERNALPNTCTRLKATQKKAVRELPLDHEAIMEEASKHDRLEYKEESEDESKDKSNKDSKECEESKSESE